jgi:hypothetical protein
MPTDRKEFKSSILRPFLFGLSGSVLVAIGVPGVLGGEASLNDPGVLEGYLLIVVGLLAAVYATVQIVFPHTVTVGPSGFRSNRSMVDEIGWNEIREVTVETRGLSLLRPSRMRIDTFDHAYPRIEVALGLMPSDKILAEVGRYCRTA